MDSYDNKFSRKPITLTEENADLFKSSHFPDYELVELRPDQFFCPTERVQACPIFRRDHMGNLDIKYTAAQVLESMCKVRDSGGLDVLTAYEKAVLYSIFPENFPGDAFVLKQLQTQARVSVLELAEVRLEVGLQLNEILNWNAGNGGSITPRTGF